MFLNVDFRNDERTVRECERKVRERDLPAECSLKIVELLKGHHIHVDQ
jgi:hypothetical protein